MRGNATAVQSGVESLRLIHGPALPPLPPATRTSARAEVAAGTLCGGRDRALLLPGALLVAIGAQLLAAFMFIDLGFSAFL